MNIVVTSQNRRTITAHAGKCRKFWRFACEDGQIKQKDLIEVGIEDTFSQSGSVLDKLRPMDILISAGMGDGLKNKLTNMGVHVLISDESDPEFAVQQCLQAGR